MADFDQFFCIRIFTHLLIVAIVGCQTVHFTSSEYGLLNETKYEFITLSVEKTGQTHKPFAVVIEVVNSEDDFLTDSWLVDFPQTTSFTTTRTVDVFVKDDQLPENDETFTFQLKSTDADIQVDDPWTAHVTIPANDDAHGVIGFAKLGEITVEELSNGNASITVPLVRNRGTFGNVAVSYRISVSDTDVRETEELDELINDVFPFEGEVVFSDGESENDLTLYVRDDKIPENDETFEIRLLEGIGGTVVNQTASSLLVLVRSNDSPLRFSQSVYRVEEIAEYINITLMRGMEEDGIARVGPDSSAVTVEYHVLRGSATPGKDYFARRGVIKFEDGEHKQNLQILVLDDDDPELDEDFMVQLGSISGDAILAQPSECTVVIAMNDEANGVVSIDLSAATYQLEGNSGQVAFIIDEDEVNRYTSIAVVRDGGAFERVAVSWSLTFNDTAGNGDVIDYVTPSSGEIYLEANKKHASLNLTVQQNDVPAEAKALVFRLLSISGGAEIGSRNEVLVLLADSDDVYGVFQIDKESSGVLVDAIGQLRKLSVRLEREGGTLGEVEVKYSASYYPPGQDQPLPGILTNSRGMRIFGDGEVYMDIDMHISEEAFLELDAEFVFIIKQVSLVNKTPVPRAKTPRIETANITITVDPTLANGETGFQDPSDLYVDEPSNDAGPLSVDLLLNREGYSGEAGIQVSYRSVGKNAASVIFGSDYRPGPDQVFLEPGQNEAVVSITIMPDELPELEEVILVRLDSVAPNNEKLKRSASEKKIFIRENDSPGGVFQFAAESVKHYVIKENETENVILTIERNKGDLAKRFVEYDVIPDGTQQFYGVPNILVFTPGKRFETVSIKPRDDDIPELDQNYTIVLREFGDPKSVLGEHSTIHVTVLANDNPQGLFIFDDEDGRMPRRKSIGESKGTSSFVASYLVKRQMGTYGNVTVSWRLSPEGSNDVIPTSGFLEFADGQINGVITVQSVPDELPESQEEFTIFLFNATKGAEVGRDANATLIIEPNDKAIYFKGDGDVTIQEGQDLTLTVHREGSGADFTRVRYYVHVLTNDTKELPASPRDDFVPVEKYAIVGGWINFNPGVLDVLVTVPVHQDDIPEDEEVFFVELYDPRQDYVTYGNTRVRVKIEQNDNANGVFSFDSKHQVEMLEGMQQNFRISRSRGEFGEVDVYWKIVPDLGLSDAELVRDIDETTESGEFVANAGVVVFIEGQRSFDLPIEPAVDSVPEYDEQFVIVLFNASNGTPRLSSNASEVVVHITVSTNDHPHGWMSISERSAQVYVAEDVETYIEDQSEVSYQEEDLHQFMEEQVTNHVTIDVERRMGTDGFVKVLWELYPADENPIVKCKDLLLTGSLHDGALPTRGRPHTDTYAVQLEEGSYVLVSKQTDLSAIPSKEFTFTTWFIPDFTGQSGDWSNLSDTDFVYLLLSKQEMQLPTFSIILHLSSTGETSVQLKFRKSIGEQLGEFSIPLDSDVLLTDDAWHYLAVVYENEEVRVNVDGEVRGRRKVTLSPDSSTGENVTFLIGSKEGSGNSFALQDTRVYDSVLSPVQIRNQFRSLSGNDINPISGYLEYGDGDRVRNLTLSTIDDDETEINKHFRLVLLDATGGAQVNVDNMTSEITVLKNDNANGLFAFLSPCVPDHVSEGSIAVCRINRSRGFDGQVMVRWVAGTRNEHGDDLDFINFSGTVEFMPGETEKSFTVNISDDAIPEIDELHNITLVDAKALDNVKSSASYSGASINPEHASTFITINENDKPNGVLQFSTDHPPTEEDNSKILETHEMPVVHVTEESDHVTLLVVRSAGWFGHVSVEWRTRDGTAISQREPRDFQSAAGVLTFEDGQGHALIDVQLIDDTESELEKYFFVVLSSPTGGVGLNNASRVKIIIQPSDDAFGFFKFNQSSLNIDVIEPPDGVNTTTLQVIREGGSLGESILTWKVADDSSDDVAPHQGQIEFEEGQRSGVIDISILADDQPEFDEGIRVRLTEVSKGTLASSALVTATINVMANDDPRGLLMFDPPTVTASETSGNATITIRRLGGHAGTIRVHYVTQNTANVNASANGIAAANLDFKDSASSVLMAENVTTINITVTIVDDDIPESDEVFFVQLLSAELVSSGVDVPNSPRVGSGRDSLAEVVVLENDSPHGVLELSATSMRVDEDVSDGDDETHGFLSVVRKLGTFGDVSVSVNVIPGIARSQEDYNLISSEVTLLEGESSKPIQLRIVDDFTPELEEHFTVELLPDSVTGGARTGMDTTCRVTINESDDPYGVFDISVAESRLEEPETDETLPIVFTVNRRNGRRGVVSVRWQVIIVPADSAAPSGIGVNGSNPADDGHDVDVRDGVLHFVTNDTTQQFTVKIQPDDLPEDDELIRVRLVDILSNHPGRIDRSRDEAHVVVVANDRPYGDVSLSEDHYVVEEKEGVATVTLRINRSGGLYGDIRVVYSTLEMDLVSELMEGGEDLLSFYLAPKVVSRIDIDVTWHAVDIASSSDPKVTCAEACLREKVCLAFLYSPSSYECKWLTSEAIDRDQIGFSDGDVIYPDTQSVSRFSYFEKAKLKATALYGSKAQSSMDFVPVTGASVLLAAGQQYAEIHVNIIDDNEPELDEYFMVNLLSVEPVDMDSDQVNLPRRIPPTSAKITIRENDHPYGIFVLRSSNPTSSSTSANERKIEVEERPQLSLEMVVERQGGSVGDVTVDWSVFGGSAIRNDDFSGDDATLKFSRGETVKVLSLTVLDDDLPEPSEDIDIRLSNPSGGAVVDDDSDQMVVVILANDVVGGYVGFRSDSRSTIGREGGNVTLHLTRSQPALGVCHVTWIAQSVSGHPVEDGLNFTSGEVAMESGQLEASILIFLTPDSIPEIQEEYRIVLSSATSIDIPISGTAEIDHDSSEASISIQESDDPHGVFQVAPTSQRMSVSEGSGEPLKIYISRRFGSIGRARVFYVIIPGTLSTLNPDISIAEPGLDFTHSSSLYIDFEDGVTSLPIIMTVIDDDTPELNEIFHVNLTEVVLLQDVRPLLPPKIDGENSLSQIVIDANDGTKGVVRFDLDSLQVVADEIEGRNQSIQLNIVRDRGSYGEVTVFVFPQNREALLGEDFWCEAETIVLKDGQDSAIYTVSILDDLKPEGEESFEILLGSPSHGLELGNLTKANVTIRSNDDAHGRLSFDGDLHILLSEPEHNNVSNSRAELIVKRSPPEGVFGQISVRFRVERVTSGGNYVENDLFPSEGYVVIEDGVGFAVFEITATADKDPELEECFTVTLFDPQNGATLDVSATTTEICVEENDAPYGDFMVYPRGIRNASRAFRVREGPNDQVLHFDVVRHQGMLGRIDVEVQTSAGTALPLLSSFNIPPGLAPFQTFNGSGGVSVHQFEHNSNQYLVFLTSDLVAPISSPIGSDGSLMTLTAGIHSTLYKWQGVYSPVKTIETDGARSATTFVVSGRTYLFICNAGESGRRETVSRLYELTDSGSLRVLQNVDTKGATSAVHFAVAGIHRLIVTNSLDNNHISTIDSILLRFAVGQKKLVLEQMLPTRGAAMSNVFHMAMDTYLAIANRFDSEVASNSPVSSVVYKWDESSSAFSQRKAIDVSHATDIIHYNVDEAHFLVVTSAVVRNRAVLSHHPEVLKVFQVFQNDVEGNIVLRPHQTINITRVNKLEILTASVQDLQAENKIQRNFLKDNTVTLLCAASENASTCYLLDFESQFFVPFLQAMPSRQLLPHIINTSPQPFVVVAVVTSTYMVESGLSRGARLNDTFGLMRISQSGVYDVINPHLRNDSRKSIVVSYQGDYIRLRTPEILTFEPGEVEHSVAVVLIDDITPESDENFKVVLSNRWDRRAYIDPSKSDLDVIIEANDDAYGVIGFARDSIDKAVEETSTDNGFSINLGRSKSAFGRVTVDWEADGAIGDITPISGQVTFAAGESKAAIEIIVLADDHPEIEELVTIQLSNPRLEGITSSSSPPRLNATSSRSRVRILANDSPHGVVLWSPNSLHVVVNEPETYSGASKLVTLEMVRDQGTLGDIQVHFKTVAAANLPAKSRATPGVDFIERDSSLVMRENSTRAAISISINPDDAPEDIESFYVIISDVSLIGESEFSTEPGVGPPGSELAEVTIKENDDARGYIQFNVSRNQEGSIEAYELPRLNNTLRIPLVRLVGFVRAVGVQWLARPGTAKNTDFFPSSGSVQFAEGQISAYIDMWIADDDDVEFLEGFTVQLVGTSGGAQLGGDVTVSVNILPNDSPSGMFGFIQPKKRVDESTSVNDPRGVAEFKVERFQGSDEDVTLLWELDKAARADLTPVSGKLIFPATVRSRSIVLRTLPDETMEGEEVFNIRLVTATGGAEISPVAGTAKVIINANAGAAGTVRFKGCDDVLLTSEPEDGRDGTLRLGLVRGPESFGPVDVEWRITRRESVADNTPRSAFENVEGRARFEDLANETKIVIQTIDDQDPELPLDYMLRLVGVNGGAELDEQSTLCRITVVASDNPHGKFTFSQPLYYVKEDDLQMLNSERRDKADRSTVWPEWSPLVNEAASNYVSLTVLRNDGHIGEVAVSVRTRPGTASPSSDYFPVDKRLVFADGETYKKLDVEIIDDRMPEGPKMFYVTITDVTLLSVDIPPSTHSPILPLDSPPKLGDVSEAVVQIAKSDGAEGVVQFAQERIVVEEDIGLVEVPLVRGEGSYDTVSVSVNSQNQTARRNVDFLLPSDGVKVVFDDGQTMAYASIPVIDDTEMEGEESFSLVITSPKGGARLGSRLFTEIVIKKSDYPNGVLQFVGLNDVVVPNPTMAEGPTRLRFVIERRGGNRLPVNAVWRLTRSGPYLMPASAAVPLDDDVLGPQSGPLTFRDNEGGQREVVITIRPHDGTQEVEEYFLLTIDDYLPADLSPDRGNATITVLKKGHPNGVIKFNGQNEEKIINEPSSGFTQVVYPITRTQGTIGDVNVTWFVEPINTWNGASVDDLGNAKGSVVIYDEQKDAEVILNIPADQVPEILERFRITLLSASGGADIDEENKLRSFQIRPNDNPHGVFAVAASDQRIKVDIDMTRLLQVNVTRREGTFGQVVVGFKVQFDMPQEGATYLSTNTGSVEFSASTRWATEDIKMRPSVFLAVGDTFTIQLTSVEFMVGDEVVVPPRLADDANKSSAVVPPEAANSQVGFNPTVAHVNSGSRDMCELRLTRNGLYGPVTVYWTSGYPIQRLPQGVAQGRTLPPSGDVTLENLQSEVNISIKVIRSSSDQRSAFAIHVPQVYSSMGGGAKLLINRDLSEIDPCGAVRFVDYSKQVQVADRMSNFNLTVERLYGSRYDITIRYVIIPVTALPDVDYVAHREHDTIQMREGEREAALPIKLIQSSVPQKSRNFIVSLTVASQPQDIYNGLSPRVIREDGTSHVTITESPDARGVFAFADATIETLESGDDDSATLVLLLKIKRKVGRLGSVSVMVSTVGGGEPWDKKVTAGGEVKRRIADDGTKRAAAGQDYEIRQTNVTFKNGQIQALVPVVILDDDTPEPDEAFFVFLHSPLGGTRVDPAKGIIKVTIKENDLPNGQIGFESNGQFIDVTSIAYTIDEDSPTRSLNMRLTRTHAYGDATLRWRAFKSVPLDAILDDEVPTTESTFASTVDFQPVDELRNQLESTSGTVTCQQRELDCYVTLTMIDDDVSEFANSFYVILFDVSTGASIDDNRRIANVTMSDSDAPYGEFQFALTSRLPAITREAKSVGLTIERKGGDRTSASVRYVTRQLRRVVTVAGATLYPAVSNVDFVKKEGMIDFKPGEREAYLSIDLKSDSSSANPLPQVFQVVLDWASGSSKLSQAFRAANVTIVQSGDNKKVWGVYEALQQDLDDVVIQDILARLKGLAEDDLNRHQLVIFHGCLDRILEEGKQRRLSDAVFQELYILFCKLLDPNRKDAVIGYSELSSSLERFALILSTDAKCVPTDVTTMSMTSCRNAQIQSSRWYPELINGYRFGTPERDFFQLPVDLLDAKKHGVDSKNPKCYDLFFIEYTSHIWFKKAGEKDAMSNKVFSVGVNRNHMTLLQSPVKYRIYTKDTRISPQGAECVLWNEASSRWLSNSRDTCKVVDDSSNFVDCECRHMSIYAARGPTDNVAGYNEATYAACFVTMIAALVIVAGHHLCSKRSTFATKLAMHMFVACAMTQLFFVVAALTSHRLSQESCAAVAIFLHYFWLAQFTWMLMQSVNILQILVFSNENTERLFVVHFVIGWGFPAIVILLYVIIMYALGSKSLFESYGDVHQNGDMCMLMNIYGALLGAVVPAFLSVVAPITIGFHLYQKDQSWKQYDDIFRGRFNSVEIPLLFWAFFLISLTWIWGGIHLAFGHMWMLLVFIVFNFCQGFYLLIVYGILHNQYVKPLKAVYEDDRRGNDGPLSSNRPIASAGFATTAYGSRLPSVSGEIVNKSTQSLAPKFQSTWEDTGIENLGVDSADEDADFDDLMYALNGPKNLQNIDETKLASNHLQNGDNVNITEDDEISSSTHSLQAVNALPINDTHL